MRAGRRWVLSASLSLASIWPAVQVWATTQAPVAVVSLERDPRHAPRRAERAYPGHPTSPAIEGVRLGASDSAYELGTQNLALDVKEFKLDGAQGIARLLDQMKAAKVKHVVADLPVPLLRELAAQAPKALGGALVFNASQDADTLRGADCQPHLLHTYPSRAMTGDATTQYLASRRWTKVLVLHGPLEEDAVQLEAFRRSAKRFGVQIVQERPFKISGDPREKDLGNLRLLTGDRQHEVVVVVDSDGEFARTVPYATQWPRPVAGAAGLVPLAWHPQWERYGAPQLTRRFLRQTQRAMHGHDWAAWMAGRAIAAAVLAQPKGGVAAQLQALRSGSVTLDGFKGKALSFRPWDGQLRQPVFLTHGDGVLAMAPMDGVLHPTETLDTLGVDRAESACKNRP
ncbi:MAG: branched-chain amino acid ABC transporter substrate-binding protein [Hydrogenophaga sp.]|nr:branched-chain amino acid ABC transporter substrate-binding protein [Hydrogenophaga sp.]